MVFHVDVTIFHAVGSKYDTAAAGAAQFSYEVLKHPSWAVIYLPKAFRSYCSYPTAPNFMDHLSIVVRVLAAKLSSISLAMVHVRSAAKPSPMTV